MHIRLATSQDKSLWDAFVDNHSEGATPYCRFAWREAVEQSYGHKPQYLLAEEDQKILGIMPLFIFKIPILGSSLVSLPFCDVGGVIATNPDVKAALLAESFSMAKKQKVKSLVIRSTQNDLQEDCFDDWYVTVQKEKVRMLLNLPSSSDELWSSFKSKLRSQIRKAEKNGLTFRWGSMEDLPCFYKVFSRNMHDLGSPVHSKEWIEKIFVNYGESARMGLVFKEDQPVGCGIILFTKCTVSIPWASTLREFNRLSPNMLLYWNFLKYAADNEKKLFDFGRSTLNEGTYRFKKQWGANPGPLFWYKVSSSAKNQQTQSKVKESTKREKLANFWGKIPLQMANFLGPKVRKYISL
jgi:FemAB-related protein (PEP-CTERM system-associated)